MTSEPTVGLIGVGFIGRRFVESIRDAGHPLVVHDLDDDAVAWAVDRGAEAASSPAAVADSADAVLLALPGSPEVEAVMEAEDGLLGALEAGDVVIDTTTVRTRTARQSAEACRERGIHFVSAPLTRGAPVDGLFLMVGGPEEDYEAAADVIECVGAEHARFEDVETALRFKYANQMRYAGRLAVDAEVVSYVEQAGIDPSRLNEHLGMGIEERLLEDDYAKGMDGLGGLAIWDKDLGYALEDAGGDDLALPLASSVHEVYKGGHRLAEEGEGHKATIKRYWRALNGE